jgi:hypothetical protein
VLSIVHISDESEQSINPWDYYVNLFQPMKDDPADVIINAVAGDYPGGCGSALPGAGYWEATVATGGLFLSICSTDWGTHIQQLVEAGMRLRDSFELSQTPVPQTIEVRIDGIPTDAGWHYDGAANAVVFAGYSIPVAGAAIEVAYHLSPVCGQ